jgi:hypothetical protein
MGRRQGRHPGIPPNDAERRGQGAKEHENPARLAGVRVRRRRFISEWNPGRSGVGVAQEPIFQLAGDLAAWRRTPGRRRRLRDRRTEEAKEKNQDAGGDGRLATHRRFIYFVPEPTGRHTGSGRARERQTGSSGAKPQRATLDPNGGATREPAAAAQMVIVPQLGFLTL